MFLRQKLFRLGNFLPNKQSTVKRPFLSYSGDIILIFIDRLVQGKSFIDMARMSRGFVPESPHHNIQRGVRSMGTFQTGRDLSKGNPGRPDKKGK